MVEIAYLVKVPGCEPGEQGSIPVFTQICLCGGMVDTAALEAVPFGGAGSSPARGTKFSRSLMDRILGYEPGDTRSNRVGKTTTLNFS